MNQENRPLISIIIPTYNRANLLYNCIRSCLDQIYKRIEIIVVDDGSIDNTAEVMANLTKEDSRIIYFKKEHGGLSKALNYGFKYAKGNYLTWTSDDNYYAEDAIDDMLLVLQQNNCSLVYCDYYRFRKITPKKLEKISYPDVNGLTQDNCIGPCFLYSRHLMEIIGEYDSETYLAEDYDYWLRASKKLSICHVPKALYYYMEHDQSLSLQFHKNFEIQLVSTLVKFKNNILDIKGTINKLNELFLKKKLSEPHKQKGLKSFFYQLITHNKISYLWTKLRIPNRFLLLMAKYRFYKRMTSVLRDYGVQKISFTAVKSAMKNILTMKSI